MGFANAKFTVSCCFVIWLWMFPAVGQATFNFVPATTATAALSDQVFRCNTGYSLAQCHEDIRQLKKVLTRYPIQALGPWTWVLVRSEEWRPISLRLQLNPNSPAFSALEPRETFLEEALFAHDPQRTIELMNEWQRSMPQLLELAVSHELGHALCDDESESDAQHFGEELRNGLTPRCEVTKRKVAGKKNVVAGETHLPKPNALDAH